MSTLLDTSTHHPSPDGGFVVTWTFQARTFRIEGQRFHADGTPAGTHFVILGGLGIKEGWLVAGLSGGGFVVLWTERPSWTEPTAVFGQLYDVNGTAIGSQLQVTSSPESRYLSSLSS